MVTMHHSAGLEDLNDLQILLGLAPLTLKVKSGSSLAFTTPVRQAGH